MNLPPFVYALSFWKAVSFLLAGVAGLLYYFGVIPAQYALDAATFLSAIVAVLHFLNINPELRARGLK